MKRRLTALFCALALLLGATAVVMASSSTPTIYLLAVNDKFYDQYLPVSVNGVIYVPYTTFDKSATGVDLGVYYGIDRAQGTTLTLYSMDGMLVFRVGNGTCEDGQGNRMSFRAILRSDVPYVPASAVCGFFGLNYTYAPTSDRGVLVRITDNRTIHMSDSFFLSSATDAMRWRYNKQISSLQPTATVTASAAVSQTAPTTPRPTPTEGAVTHEDVTVYLAVEAWDSGRDLSELFPNGIKALFLYTPDSLEANAGRIRAQVAAGHQVGLVVEGTAEEVAGQIEAGNALLGHIARVRTRILSAPADLADGLTEAGWACWPRDVTGTSSAVLLAGLEQRRSLAYVTLPGDSAVITQTLTRIRTDGYTIRQPLETEIGGWST